LFFPVRGKEAIQKMLVLTRKTGERIQIGPDIWVTIVRIGPHVVRVGIDAPSEVNIVREEIAGTLPVGGFKIDELPQAPPRAARP
jgi:carbon storage regulator